MSEEPQGPPAPKKKPWSPEVGMRASLTTHTSPPVPEVDLSLKQELHSPNPRLEVAVREGPTKDSWHNLLIWQAAFENDPEFQAGSLQDQNISRRKYFKDHILPYAKSSDERDTFLEYLKPDNAGTFISHVIHGIIPFAPTRAELRQKMAAKWLANTGPTPTPIPFNLMAPPESPAAAAGGEALGQLIPMAIGGGLVTKGVQALKAAPALARILTGAGSFASATAYRWASGDATAEDVGKAALEGALGWGPKSKLVGGLLTGGYAALTAPKDKGGKFFSDASFERGLTSAALVTGTRFGFEKVLPATLKGYQSLKQQRTRGALLKSGVPVNLTGSKVESLYEISPAGQIAAWMAKNSKVLEMPDPRAAVGKVIPLGEEQRIEADRANIVRDGMLVRSTREASEMKNILLRLGKEDEYTLLLATEKNIQQALQKGTQEEALAAYAHLDRIIRTLRNTVVATTPADLLGGNGYIALTERGIKFLEKAGIQTRKILVGLAKADPVDITVFNSLSDTPGPFGYSSKDAYIASMAMSPKGTLSPNILKLLGITPQGFPEEIQTMRIRGLFEVKPFPRAEANAVKLEGSGRARFTIGDSSFEGEIPEDLSRTLAEIENSKLPAAEKESIRRTLLGEVLPRSSELGTLKHRGAVFSPVTEGMSESAAINHINDQVDLVLPQGALRDVAKIHFEERLQYHIDNGRTPTEAYDNTMQEFRGFDFQKHIGGQTLQRDFIRELEANAEATWPEDIIMTETSTDWGQGPVTTARPPVEIATGMDSPGLKDPMLPGRLMRRAGVQGTYYAATGEIIVQLPNGKKTQITLAELEALPRAGSSTPRGDIVITTQANGWMITRNPHNGKYEFSIIDPKTKKPTGVATPINKKDLKDALYANKGWLLRSELPDGSLIVTDLNTTITSAKTPAQVKAALSNPSGGEDFSLGIKVPPKASSVNADAVEPIPDTIVGLESLTPDQINKVIELSGSSSIEEYLATRRPVKPTRPPVGEFSSAKYKEALRAGLSEADADAFARGHSSMEEYQKIRSRATLASMDAGGNPFVRPKAVETPRSRPKVEPIIRKSTTREATPAPVETPLPPEEGHTTQKTPPRSGILGLMNSGGGGRPVRSIEQIQAAEAVQKGRSIFSRAWEKTTGTYLAAKKSGILAIRGIVPKKPLFDTLQNVFGIPIWDWHVAANQQYLNTRAYFRKVTPLLQKTVFALHGKDQRAILDFVQETDMRRRAEMLQSKTNPNGLTSKEVAIATDAEELLRQSFGVQWNRMLVEDYPQALLNEYTPEMSAWMKKGGLVPSLYGQGNLAGLLSNAVSSRARIHLDTVTSQALDLIQVIRDLPSEPPPITVTRTAPRVREGPPGTPQFEQKTTVVSDRHWLPDSVKKKVIKELAGVHNQLIRSLSTDHVATETFMAGTFRYMGFTEEQIPKALVQGQFLPNFLLLTYSGTLPFVASVPIKNATQTLTTTALYAGPDNYARGLQRTFTKKGWALAKELNIHEMSSVPLEHLLGGTSTESSLWNRRIHNVRQLYDVGMLPLEIGDIANRAISANVGYAAVEAHAPLFLQGKSTLQQFLCNTGIVYLGKSAQASILKGLVPKSLGGKITEASWRSTAVEYARHLQEDTQWLYHAGNSAGFLNTKVGRFLGQYATWPTHYLQFLTRGLTTGDLVATKNFIGRFLLVNGAITQVGRQVFGVDPSNWLFTGPLMYTGGPAAEIAVSMYDAFSGGFRGEMGQERLKRASASLIPMYGAARNVWRVLTSEDETAAKVIRFFGMRPYEK